MQKGAPESGFVHHLGRTVRSFVRLRGGERRVHPGIRSEDTNTALLPLLQEQHSSEKIGSICGNSLDFGEPTPPRCVAKGLWPRPNVEMLGLWAGMLPSARPALGRPSSRRCAIAHPERDKAGHRLWPHETNQNFWGGRESDAAREGPPAFSFLAVDGADAAGHELLVVSTRRRQGRLGRRRLPARA